MLSKNIENKYMEKDHLSAIKPSTEYFNVNGRTYSALVSGEGPTVLCLHGFPDTYHSFRYQIPELVAQGYRVVCPVMPGYEESSLKSDNQYSIDYVSDEIIALARAVTHEPVHIIGHDWGAIAAYAAATKSPELFASLSALTIPHNMLGFNIVLQAPRQASYSWYIAFFQLRGLSERILSRNNFALIDKLYRDWSPSWSAPKEQLLAIKEVLAKPQLKAAALGYYRSIFSLKGIKLLSGTIKVPSLLIQGNEDGCIHQKSWSMVQHNAFKKGVEVRQVNAGHFLHIEKPDEVNALLIAHLKNN